MQRTSFAPLLSATLRTDSCWISAALGEGLAGSADRRVDLKTLVEDDEALADHIRHNVAGTFHPVGTCRMGADEAAVVDGALRVRGFDGLRVADASVMPSITSGNTNAPTVMIAEKAAEMMLAGA